MNQSKKGYKDNIEQETLSNTNFRTVLYTGKLQLVLMTLKPHEDIGEEVHNGHDQFFRFESGVGKVLIGDEIFEVKDGDAIVVPDGIRHNVTNVSDTEDLTLYTIYAPPEHKDGIVHITKEEALADENDHFN